MSTTENTLIRQSLPGTVVVLALYTSLQSHGYDYSFRWLLLAWFMLLTLILGKFFISYHDKLTLPTNKPFLLFCAFLGWITLSLFWSTAPGESLLASMRFTICLFALLLGFWADDKQWRYFSRLLWLLALITIVQTTWQRFALNIPRPSGFLLNWNTNSAFIAVILLPVCALFLNHAKQRQNLVLPGLFISLSAFGMSLGQSRGALLGLIIGLGITMLAAWRMQYHKKAIAFLLIIVAAGYLTGDLLNDGAVINRLSETTELAGNAEEAPILESVGSGRHALWDAGWHMYLDKPLLGWGLGMYHNLYAQYRPPLIQERGMYAHNDYLQFLLELGPIGLLLSLAFVFTVLHSCLKLYRSGLENTEKLQQLSLLAGCIALLSHSFFTFNLYQPSMLILLGMYLGQAGKFDSSKQISFTPANTMTSKGYFGVIGSSATLLSIFALVIFIGFNSVQKSKTSTDAQQQFEHLNQASMLLPFMDEFKNYQIGLILKIVNQPSALNAAQARGLLGFALDLSNQAIENNPLRYVNFSNKAKVLQAQSRFDKTVDSNDIIDNLKQTLRLNPYDLDTRLMLAELYVKQGDSQQYLKTLIDGINKKYTGDYDIGMRFLRSLKRALPSPADETLLRNLNRWTEKQQKLLDSPYKGGAYTFKIE